MFKRFYHQGESYFITTKTKDNVWWFCDYNLCKIVIKNLEISKKLYCFDIYSFIVMPDHLHIVICPKGNYNISKIMQCLKQNISRDVNRYYALNVASTPSSKLSALGREKYGYDIYKITCRDDAVTKTCSDDAVVVDTGRDAGIMYSRGNDDGVVATGGEGVAFQWQHSFYDRLIRNEYEFDNVLDYINIKNLIDLNTKYNILTEDQLLSYSFYSYSNPDLIDPV